MRVKTFVIGGADGPTAVFLAGRVSDKYLIGAVLAGAALLLLAAFLLWKWKHKR